MSIELLAVHNHLDALSRNAFGKNSAVGGTLEDIWAMGGSRTEITTASAVKVSSSSGSDTFDLQIRGLDANWDMQTVTQTLAGQTETAVSGSTWMRVDKIVNNTGTAAVGDVYCYLDDTVSSGVPQTQGKILAKMPIGFERSMGARISIPDGYKGYIVGWGVYIDAAAASETQMMYRKFGKVPRVRRVVDAYFVSLYVPYTLPLECEPKSDIYVEAKGNGAVAAEISAYIHKV